MKCERIAPRKWNNEHIHMKEMKTLKYRTKKRNDYIEKERMNC